MTTAHPGAVRPPHLPGAYNSTTPVDPRVSDTLAVLAAALAHRDRGDHIITQLTEHAALLVVGADPPPAGRPTRPASRNAWAGSPTRSL